MLKVYQYFRTL